MAASQFGPVTQNATPAPKQTEQIGGPDPSGNLQPVNIDGAGNLKVAVTGAGSGGTSSVDESAFAAGVSAGTPAMGVYEATPSALGDGELGIVAVDANRNLKVNIVAGSSGNGAAGPTGDPVPAQADYQGFQNPSGALEGVAAENFDYDSGAGSQPQTAYGLVTPASGGPLPVPGGSGTATGALRVELPTNGTGTLATVAAVTAITNPVTVAQATASNLKAQVTGAGSAGTPDSGVQTIQGIASMTPVQVSQATPANLNAQVVGTIADDATTPGNPVMIGGSAKSPDGTSPGNVSAEDDVTRAITDLNRRLFVNNVHPATVKAHFDGSTAYSDEQIAGAPGSGLQIVITFIQFSSGGSSAINMFLEEGSTKVFGPIYLEAVAGRGYVSGPMYLPITPNTAVTFTTSASQAQSVEFQYFIQKV